MKHLAQFPGYKYFSIITFAYTIETKLQNVSLRVRREVKRDLDIIPCSDLGQVLGRYCRFSCDHPNGLKFEMIKYPCRIVMI